jgi:hypothetical protein
MDAIQFITDISTKKILQTIQKPPKNAIYGIKNANNRGFGTGSTFFLWTVKSAAQRHQ